MEEKKTRWYTNKKIMIGLTILLTMLVIGTAFAYYFAILKGENVNTASMADASLIYTEPKSGIETKQMSDYDGMNSEDSYDFTITGSSNGTTSIKYGIYAEEEEGNTIDASQIKVYLTDENDIPYEEYVERIETAWFTPDGSSLEYNYGVDYQLEYNYNDATGTSEGRTNSTEEALYLGYAEHILGLSEGESFYVKTTKYDDETDEEREVCVEYTYNYGPIEPVPTIEEKEEAELSLCDVSLGWSFDETTGNEYESLIDNEGTPIIKITSQEYNVKIIEDGEEKKYEFMHEYLTEKSGSSTYYVKNIYAFEDAFDYELQGLPDDLPSYCTNQNDDIVEDSNCDSAYQMIVGKAVPKVLSEKSNNFDARLGENNSLSNPIGANAMVFKNGEIAPLEGKHGDPILEMRYYQNPHKYKLRYWIDEDATSSDSGENQEVTTTDEEKTHTVQFGSSGTFKFKVNIYAIQG